MVPKNRVVSRLAAALLRVLGFFTVSAICGVLAASLVVPGVAAASVAFNRSIVFFKNLPSELTVDSPSQSTTVLSADGKTIATFYEENRMRVSLDQMSPYVKEAIVAIEDARFYDHAGVDPQGILRALSFNLTTTGGRVLGAYNTQQKKAGLGATEDLQNNDAGYYRPMSADYGLYNSINTATFAEAAQLDFCGIQKIVDAVGLHSGLDNARVNMHQLGNLLGAIGVAPLHLANAFATFANDGRYCSPVAILEVTDAAGRKLPAQTNDCRDAVKPEVARGVNSVLQDVLKRGSGVYIAPKVHTRFPVAAKTGTSNNNGATWVAGYTTSIATASFFGDALEGQKRPGQNISINGKFYKAIDGYMLAGPQWANYMMQVAGLYPASTFPPPPESMT
ncbi:transglycosylase domain-containing protein [Arthrobacter sp. UYCu712]|uniref:transglycosylase domain-containing protein n=1 Tax=Arthrobacter sp. UYCu712 TaxID=3156340 RepID=UPI003399B168